MNWKRVIRDPTREEGSGVDCSTGHDETGIQ